MDRMTTAPAFTTVAITFGIYCLVPFGLVLYPQDDFACTEAIRIYLN
jgi:hypothetical protein